MDHSGLRGRVVEILRNGLHPDMLYHDVEHTLDVLSAACNLATLEKINPENYSLVVAAALLHDTGMIHGYDGHENASVQIARDLLPEFGYPPDNIETVCGIIMATEFPHKAQTHLQQLVCDADLDYLGRDDYFIISQKLWHEWNRTGFKKLKLEEWLQFQLDFFKMHHYYTPSADKLRNEGKLKNFRKIEELLREKTSK